MPAYDSRQVTPNVTPPGIGYDPMDPTHNPGAPTSTTTGAQDRTGVQDRIGPLATILSGLALAGVLSMRHPALANIRTKLLERVPGLFEKFPKDINVQMKDLPSTLSGQVANYPNRLAIQLGLATEPEGERLATVLHEMFHPIVQKFSPEHQMLLARHAEEQLPFGHLEAFHRSIPDEYGRSPQSGIQELVTRLMEYNVMRKKFPEYTSEMPTMQSWDSVADLPWGTR